MPYDDYNPAGAGDRDAIKSDGSIAANAQAVGCTLASSSTYYIPLGSFDAPTASRVGLVSIHLAWNAALAATITFESCNFPALLGGAKTGANDVSDIDTTAGNWIQENPTATLIVVGTGNSASNLTITAGGTNAGGTIVHLGNIGSRRVRVKVVVTTGGILRCNPRGKQGQ